MKYLTYRIYHVYDSSKDSNGNFSLWDCSLELRRYLYLSSISSIAAQHRVLSYILDIDNSVFSDSGKYHFFPKSFHLSLQSPLPILLINARFLFEILMKIIISQHSSNDIVIENVDADNNKIITFSSLSRLIFSNLGFIHDCSFIYFAIFPVSLYDFLTQFLVLAFFRIRFECYFYWNDSSTMLYHRMLL